MDVPITAIAAPTPPPSPPPSSRSPCPAPLESLSDIPLLPQVFDAQPERTFVRCEAESEYETGSEYASEPQHDSEYLTDAENAVPEHQPAQHLTKKEKRKREHEDRVRNSKKLRLQGKRQREARGRTATTLRATTFSKAPTAVRTRLKSKRDMPVNSTGFSALRRQTIKVDELWTLKELRKNGKRILEWDGRLVISPSTR